MGKIIKMTPELVAQCREEFEAALADVKLADGKFTYSKNFNSDDRKATIRYTKDAWDKQSRILKEFGKEVAWHGVAFRDEKEEDVYHITDIIVYPQTVTSTTVEMDTEAYAMWLAENYEDERFNSLFMQAHSHVQMSTSPSATDLSHQEEILAMLKDDGFYIFMIWNKSLSKTIKIYDMKKNVLFEDKDITVVIDGDDELDIFIEQAKKMVEDKVSTVKTTYGQTGYTPGANYSQTKTTPYNPVGQARKPGITVYQGKGTTKDERPRTRIDSPFQGRSYGDYGYDYEEMLREVYGDDYNSPFYYNEK